MASMRKAINAKCKECIYDPLAGGTWRQQVEECTFSDCALWTLRPTSSSPRSPENRGESGQSQEETA